MPQFLSLYLYLQFSVFFLHPPPPFLPSSLRTWVVPAAPGGAASPPFSLVERGAPFLQLVVLQGVGRQVADLQTTELAQEVAE